MFWVVFLALLCVALFAVCASLGVYTLTLERKVKDADEGRRNGREANPYDTYGDVKVKMPSSFDTHEQLVVTPEGAEVTEREPDALVNCSAGQKIPPRMFQSYSTSELPYRMAKAVEGLTRMHAGMAYEFYDDKGMYKWLGEHCTPRVLEAVQAVKPGAYKCDIFRLAKLYVDGGWYFDIYFDSLEDGHTTTGMFHNLAEYAEDTELVLVEDRPSEYPWGVYQAMLGAKPKHPVLGYVLDRIVDDVLNRVRPDTALGLTGPMAFGRYMREFLVREQRHAPRHLRAGKHLSKTVVHWLEDKQYTLMNGTTNQPMMRTKYMGFRHDQTPGLHYGVMFLNGDLYDETSRPAVSSKRPAAPGRVNRSEVEARLVR